MKEYKTFTTYTGSATKEVQYISLENCKTDNERSLFEIYDYYVGILNSPHSDNEQREFANGIRNEAAAILNSVLQGYQLALLQSKFLSKFNQWYKIGEIEYSTSFDFFLKNQISTTHTQGMILFNSNLEAKQFHVVQKRTTTEMEILLICRTIHTDLLAAKFGNGKFVQC